MSAPNLLEAIERGLSTIEDNWGDERLHVSDLSVALPLSERKCPRELVMRLLKFPKRPQTLGETLMFDHANRIHERVVELLRIGLVGYRVLHVEGTVLLPKDIVGTFDTVLQSVDSDMRYIVDYKTVRGAAFRFMDGPRQSAVLQVRSYCMAEDIPEGILLYIDREGQNYLQQYPVYRDDEQVRGAILIASGYRKWVEDYQSNKRFDLPSIFTPIIQRKENKGPDSIKLKMPWQCEWCNYLDVSCVGALTPDERIDGIVGHVLEDDTVRMKPECEFVRPLVESLLAE